MVATKLYQKGYIYLGTLLAVYFATSDEAIPILFSYATHDPLMWGKLLLLIFIKVVYGVIIGFIFNYVAVKFLKKEKQMPVDIDHEHDHDEGCCGHGVTEERHGFKQFILHPLIHSLKIVLYIFLVNLALGVVIDLWIGEDKFYSVLQQSFYFQPLVSVVIGFIPNCASSVFIAELFANNALSFGATLVGLTANSGLGLIILLKDKANFGRTCKIMGIIFVLCLILGYGTLFIGG